MNRARNHRSILARALSQDTIRKKCAAELRDRVRPSGRDEKSSSDFNSLMVCRSDARSAHTCEKYGARLQRLCIRICARTVRASDRQTSIYRDERDVMEWGFLASITPDASPGRTVRPSGSIKYGSFNGCAAGFPGELGARDRASSPPSLPCIVTRLVRHRGNLKARNRDRAGHGENAT
jgi:hypothetical protein